VRTRETEDERRAAGEDERDERCPVRTSGEDEGGQTSEDERGRVRTSEDEAESEDERERTRTRD
jgi:hypothetical protein